jgi:hypothetical protein
MSNFKITKNIDSDNSVLNSFIPVGTLIMKAIPPSKLSQYDTDEECLKAGVVPCDGRYLSPYTFKNLHSVISNLYGGNEYTDNFTEIQRTASSFSVVTYGDFSLNRYIRLFLNNSDGAITIRDDLVIPGYYESGAQITGVSPTYVDFWDKDLLFFSPTLPITVSKVFGFKVPNLRLISRKSYISGLSEASKEQPVMLSGSSLFHNHSYDILGPVSGVGSTSGRDHTHAINHSSAGLNTSHVHFVQGGYNGNTGQQAPNYTQAKVDGNGAASASNHSHGVAVNFSGNSAGTTYNRDHSHNGSGNSSSNTISNLHNHSVSTTTISSVNNEFTISGSGHTGVLPSISMLYFIKI